jgi:hypothetical protein
MESWSKLLREQYPDAGACTKHAILRPELLRKKISFNEQRSRRLQVSGGASLSLDILFPSALLISF